MSNPTKNRRNLMSTAVDAAAAALSFMAPLFNQIIPKSPSGSSSSLFGFLFKAPCGICFYGVAAAVGLMAAVQLILSIASAEE